MAMTAAFWAPFLSHHRPEIGWKEPTLPLFSLTDRCYAGIVCLAGCQTAMNAEQRSTCCSSAKVNRRFRLTAAPVHDLESIKALGCTLASVTHSGSVMLMTRPGAVPSAICGVPQSSRSTSSPRILVNSHPMARTSLSSICLLAKSKAVSTSWINVFRYARRCCGSDQSMSAF